MAPSSSSKESFGHVHTNALQTGFKERGWDPYETQGKRINAIIKGETDLFAVLKPFFSEADGGTKRNNNSIYTHYKTQASEFIVDRALLGIRRPKDDEEDEEEQEDAKLAAAPRRTVTARESLIHILVNFLLYHLLTVCFFTHQASSYRSKAYLVCKETNSE